MEVSVQIHTRRSSSSCGMERGHGFRGRPYLLADFPFVVRDLALDRHDGDPSAFLRMDDLPCFRNGFIPYVIHASVNVPRVRGRLVSLSGKVWSVVHFLAVSSVKKAAQLFGPVQE